MAAPAVRGRVRPDAGTLDFARRRRRVGRSGIGSVITGGEDMPIAKRWTADINLSEHPEDEVVHTRGEARKHPEDADVPEIGDEHHARSAGPRRA